MLNNIMENQHQYSEKPLKAFLKFIIDIIVFLLKSLYFIAETFLYTILPDRYRYLKKVNGQVVLITGGGGGIGRYIALNFAKLDALVVIWDINETAIKETIDFLANKGYTNCKGYVMDIANRKQLYQIAKKTQMEIGHVDILINNAGIAYCKPFWNLTDEEIANTFNINIIAHFWTVRAFIPYMLQSNRGHIVTIASATGLLGTYGCTDYSATKFSCIGFHESLFTELKTHGYNNIHMTLVCPAYINTNMFYGVKPHIISMLEPQYVADRVVNSIRKNEVWCFLPYSIRLFTALKYYLPAKICWELISRVVRVPKSMMLYSGKGPQL